MTDYPWLRKFRGLFFASSVAIGDGGAAGDDGGGDGGGAGGGGDDGDAGDDGAGDEEIPAGDEGAGDEDTAGDDDQSGDEGEGEDGEKKPANARTPEQRAKALEKSINDLRKTDPEGSKLVRREHFQNQEFRESFESPQQAREAKATIEELGGAEGIETMRQQVEQHVNELSDLAKGNPQAIENMARDFPKGLVKLAPLAFDKLAALNPAVYEQTLSRHMSRALAEKGVTHSADRIIELLGDGKTDRALALARDLRAWIETADRFGKAAPAAAADKEELSEVEQQRAEVEQDRVEIFNQKVSTAVTTSMNSIIARHLKPLIDNFIKSGGRLKLEQKQDLAVGTYTQISKQLEASASYQRQLKALIAKGDVQKINRYVSSEVARIAKKSTRAVWDRRGFTTSTAKNTSGKDGAGAGAGQNARPTFGKKPSADRIDWSKDRSKMRYMSGEATLLPQFGGKIVKWDRDAL
jgi:hypothetical protein